MVVFYVHTLPDIATNLLISIIIQTTNRVLGLHQNCIYNIAILTLLQIYKTLKLYQPGNMENKLQKDAHGFMC